MARGSGGISKTFVWILMGLLFVGLAGFGATNLSGTIRTVGSVGDQSISVDAYFRELQQEIRAVEAQTRQRLPMAQAQALGLDQTALARLVTRAALDQETADLGISIGDENLQAEILQIPAFQGLNGSFDRESYRFALNQAGMSESEFEDDLRRETARTLVQGAVLSGVEMPAAATDAVVDFIAARRSFTWAALTAEDLETPLPTPSSGDLRGFYEDNLADYTLPETKVITYALLSPEMIIDTVEVDADALRALYDERSAEFNQPERRLVERLVYTSEDAAAAAVALVESGETTFDALVEDRGLALADVDLGDVTRDALGAAADAIFAAEINDVVGPLPSSLGPALFRINGSLAAQITSFDEAEPELRDELASDRARRVIEAQSQDVDDLLAGGATIEELTSETDMELGQIDWTEASFEGVAAYDGFRTAAIEAQTDDFPEVAFLEDGSIFALRVNEVLAPRAQPFEDARPRVAEDWRISAQQAELEGKANRILSTLATDGDFQAAELVERTEAGLTRSAFIEGTPPTFMTEVFEMKPGDLRVISGGGAVIIVRLDETLPPADTSDTEALRTALAQQLNQALAQDLFDAYARDAQLRARPQIDQRALNAVHVNFQ
ncbi:MAG: peptidyl-prolyl cis-trans isomerase [Pseudomonadota bacterium]